MANVGQGRKTVADRYWPKVDVQGEDECWSWKGGISRTGCGITHFKDWENRVFKTSINASRVAWYFAHGELPPVDTVLVKTSCEDKGCQNPKHLYLIDKGDR